jgi:adenylate cyclase
VSRPEEQSNGADAAAAFEADFFLLGEVRRSGSRVRIAPKLQDPRTRVVEWAEHYDREIGDFFAALDELSGHMAGRINTRIESLMVSRQVSGRTLTSYDHLIKGIWHFRSDTPDGPEIAERMFRKARELNPANAEALRWLSIRMTCLWLYEHKREVLLEGLALGRAAAELDPASATCHAAHGFAQLWAKGVESASISFQKAYAANPNDGYMLADVALTHIYGGRLDEGYAILDRAEQLNPFPNDWHSHYRSIGRFSEGRYADAIPGLQRLPLGVYGLVYLMSCYGHLGRSSEIQALAPKLKEIDCNLEMAAADEPFTDRSTRERLAEGIRLAVEAASWR